MKSLRWIGLAILLLLITSGYAFGGQWLPQVAKFLVIDEKPVESDLIVVLSGHHSNERIMHGFKLYKEGYAPKILVSGSWELAKETGIHLGKKYLEILGVPAGDILIEDKSISTYENALAVRKILEEKKIESFILVTSPVHSFRARHIFKKTVPKNIRWLTSTPQTLDINQWWKKVEVAREVCYEYLAFIFYFLRKQ